MAWVNDIKCYQNMWSKNTERMNDAHVYHVNV